MFESSDTAADTTAAAATIAADIAADDAVQSSSNQQTQIPFVIQGKQTHIETSLAEVQKIGNTVHWLMQIIQTADFKAKYGKDFENKDRIHYYCFVNTIRNHIYTIEAFASVQKLLVKDGKCQMDEIVYHSMFEDLIARYTQTRAKPNPILAATRSSDFCYHLTIHIEAVPPNKINHLNTLTLVREYMILTHIWENFSHALSERRGSTDLLIGIPMPFEFVSVPCEEFELQNPDNPMCYSITGELTSVKETKFPMVNGGIKSSLSYMSVERLGPSVDYLMELLHSQGMSMSVGTALKIYDQLICRLIVLNRCNVVLGNISLDELKFGCKEACNVLYISNFENAMVSSGTKPTPIFSDTKWRFASMRVIRRQCSHFLQDLETAFYILVAMLTRRLPWDRSRDIDSKYNKLDTRRNFWSNFRQFRRLLNDVFYNIKDGLFQSFTIEIMSMLYSKNRDFILPVNSAINAKPQEVDAVSSVFSAFSSIRSITLSYFRIDSPTFALRDSVCLRKVEMLIEEGGTDQRCPLDLNVWCWTVLRPKQFVERMSFSENWISRSPE